jgi:hypothetical protein
VSVPRAPSPSRLPSLDRAPSPSRLPSLGRALSPSRLPSLGRAPSPNRLPSLGRAPSPSRLPSSSRAPSPSRLPSGVSSESLAALIGLQPFPLEENLVYPPLNNSYFSTTNGKITFGINDWINFFVGMNNFPSDPTTQNIEEDTTKLDGFSEEVTKKFVILKTLNNNNTSIIHAYLFARSKAYKHLLLDKDRQTCVNAFIEKILKTKYLDDFKTKNKYNFLNDVIYINSLLLSNFKTIKFISYASEPIAVPCMVLYFDGKNYKVCLVKLDKKFLFPLTYLKLF